MFFFWAFDDRLWLLGGLRELVGKLIAWLSRQLDGDVVVRDSTARAVWSLVFFSFNVFVLLTLFLLVWVLVVLLLIPVCEQLTPAQAGCEGFHVQLGLPVPLDRYMYCCNASCYLTLWIPPVNCTCTRCWWTMTSSS